MRGANHVSHVFVVFISDSPVMEPGSSSGCLVVSVSEVRADAHVNKQKKPHKYVQWMWVPC